MVDWLEVEGKGPMLLQLPSTLDSHRRNNGRYHKIKTVAVAVPPLGYRLTAITPYQLGSTYNKQ